jgi:hypothetical protein
MGYEPSPGFAQVKPNACLKTKFPSFCRLVGHFPARRSCLRANLRSVRGSVLRVAHCSGPSRLALAQTVTHFSLVDPTVTAACGLPPFYHKLRA